MVASLVVAVIGIPSTISSQESSTSCMAHHFICPSSLLLRHGLTDSWQSKGSWITMLKRVSHRFHIPYNNYMFGASSLPGLLDLHGILNLPEKVVYGGPKSESPWKRITLNHLATKYDKGKPRPLDVRGMSNLPENRVYGGPKSQSPWKRITLNHLATKYAKGEPITMVTAYDYPSAVHVDNAGIDVCLVGDSVGMVVHGHDTTLPVTLDDMLLHCRAVSRGASRSLLVGDLPFGSYEESKEQAVASATRLLKEGGMDAIKLEGGTPSRVIAARSIVEAGIAVIGHVGLTPQAISVLGGFRPQGRNAASATKVLESALALQDAGCFAIVLECVPSPVAAATTSSLQIPTIGIGAGPYCSGQVLVYHDLLQMTQHPHHAQVTPKFCKAYGNIGIAINEALCKYREEVVSQKFPSAAHTPYRIDQSSVETFIAELSKRGLGKAAQAASLAANNDDKSGEPRISTLPD